MPPTRRATLQTFATVGAAGLAGLAGCSTVARLRGPNEKPPGSLGTYRSAPSVEWRFPDGDVRNTASVPRPVPTAPEPVWRVDPGVEPQDLAVAGDRVYVGGASGGFAALAVSA